ncbi:MAG: glycosyltransferase family 4 protein [Caulobacterales bacterium]|nr:glycosyltransferase family 4 protein [Caulobacterales bacterium]
MHVHQIINSVSLNAGGAERLVRALHVGLMDHGVSSRVLALESGSVDSLPHARSLRLSSSYDPRAVVGLARYLAREVRPGDVVHAHLFPTSLFVSMTARRAGRRGPVVFTEHNTSNRRRDSAIGRLVDNALYRRFDRVFAISQGTEDALLAWQPQLSGRTSVIMNGARLMFSKPIERPAPARPVILSVGRLKPAKNFDSALLALSFLKDEPFEYRIAGDGPERAALERQTAALGLGSKVTFMGRVDDIKPQLEAAHIFLMPSRWEGFGLAAVEAMNASLPLVVSDVAGLAEVVGPAGECALRVSPDDPEQIAGAVRSLLNAPDRRARLGRAAFERSGRFGEARMVEEYIAAYRDVIERGAHAGR